MSERASSEPALPQDSLAAGRDVPAALGDRDVQALSGTLPEVSRVQLRQSAGEVSDVTEREYLTLSPGRLQLGAEIARGGMGVVLRGHDVDLGRDLAVKVLLDDHVGRPGLSERFIEEAQIAGQLQHPGIVPVYELGQFPDQRPYFTMKLIKGQTLVALLQQRTDPEQDRTRFLKVFEQVCQALAYAHSRSVIHRDLKPANVMVGAFGEVQVMDWGLAKVLAEGRDAAPSEPQPVAISVIRTRRSDGSDVEGSSGTETAVGSVLGTPAYIPREQALGEIDRLDERCDVFGLGGILCEILTGQPPYVGKDINEMLRKAARADLTETFARLDACGTDPELIALARRCLGAEPEDRPRDAGVLAEELTGYLQSVEDRLRRAHLERAQAEVRVGEERKRRRVLLGLAATMLMLVLGSAAGGLWLQQQATERRAAVAAALDKVADLQRQARWKEAAAVLDQAEQRLGDASAEELRQRLRQARTDLTLVAMLDAARLRRATVVDSKFLDGAGARQGYAAALQEAGLGQVGDDVGPMVERVRGSAVRDPILAALDHWAALERDESRRAWLLAVARRVDPGPRLDRFRDPVLGGNKKALQQLAREAEVETLSPWTVQALAEVLLREKVDALPLLRAAQARHPSDFWLNFYLGNGLTEAQHEGEAEGYYRAALALRPDSSVVYNNLGLVLYKKNQLAEAIQAFQKAAALDPKYVLAHNNLGLALYCKGRLDEAMKAYEKAIELDPQYARAYYNLGIALRSHKQLDKAIQAFQRAIDLDPRYAPAHYSLGNALYDAKRVVEAIQAFQKAIDLDPTDAKVQDNLGSALKDAGQLEAAIQAYKTAIELEPKDASTHLNLGTALKAAGQPDEAIDAFQKAIQINPGYAQAYNGLGTALGDKQQLAAAIEAFQKAVELNPKYDLAYNNLGRVLYANEQLDEARKAFQKATALNPTLAHAHFYLGLVLKEKEKWNEAIDAFQKAFELLPRHDLRRAAASELEECQHLRNLEARLPAFLKGDTKPANVSEQIELALLCAHKRRFATAARFYADAFTAVPKRADEVERAYRYNAACSAALAAAGQGEDAGQLDEKERARLRKQALDWLRADLDAWTKQAESDQPKVRQIVADRMCHWQRDDDLRSLRDAETIEKLPADEQQAWKKLWDDVAMLLKKAETQK